MQTYANTFETKISHQTVQVLIVGPWGEGDFSELLRTVPASISWQRAAHCSDAAALIAEGESNPELILLADPCPNTHTRSDVEQLRLAAPLARLVVVAGTWCEGELRTGAPLDGVVRLYWYEFPGWWQSSMARIERGKCPLWSLPPDGPSAGRNIGEIHAHSQALTGNIAIDAKSLATFESLASAVDDCGARTFWTRRGKNSLIPDQLIAGIWDGGQLEPLEVERLETFCRVVRERGGIVFALLDFPRREHTEIVLAAGCSAVMGKPYVVSELVERIAALL